MMIRKLQQVGEYNIILAEYVSYINVGSFLGPLQMVVEYASCGNLRDFLREHISAEFIEDVPDESSEPAPGRVNRVNLPLTHDQLVSFSFQIARGMQYLSAKQVSFLIRLSIQLAILTNICLLYLFEKRFL